MVLCARCQKQLNILERLQFNQPEHVCSSCRTFITQRIHQLTQELHEKDQRTGIPPDHRRYLADQFAMDRIPANYTTALIADCDRRIGLSQLRSGNLPTIPVSTLLGAGEQAHLEIPASYYKQYKRETKVLSGKMLVTSRAVYFLTGGANNMTILLSNIVNVVNVLMHMDTHHAQNLLRIEVSKGVGGGYYAVQDVDYVASLISGAVRKAKR